MMDGVGRCVSDDPLTVDSPLVAYLLVGQSPSKEWQTWGSIPAGIFLVRAMTASLA